MDLQGSEHCHLTLMGTTNPHNGRPHSSDKTFPNSEKPSPHNNNVGLHHLTYNILYISHWKFAWLPMPYTNGSSQIRWCMMTLATKWKQNDVHWLRKLTNIMQCSGCPLTDFPNNNQTPSEHNIISGLPHKCYSLPQQHNSIKFQCID